jgi:tetratricopeptide (TPR) repeat protein
VLEDDTEKWTLGPRGSPDPRRRTSELPVEAEPRGLEVAGRGSRDGAGDLVAQLLNRAEEADSQHDARAAGLLLGQAARVLEESGDPEGAFQVARLAFQRTPHEADVGVTLVRLAEALGRTDELRELLEEVTLSIGNAGTSADLWTWKARSLRAVGRLGEAQQAAEQALRLEPGTEAAWVELEELHRRQGHAGPLARLLEQRALALESARTDEQRGAASAQLVALHLAPVPYGPAPRAVSPVSDDEVTQARIRPAALRRR